MGGTPTKGASTRGDRGFEGGADRQTTEEGLEANGDQSLLCGRWLHTKTPQIRALHPAYGTHTVLLTLLCAVLSIASQLWFPVVTECSDPEHPGLHPEHDFGRLLYVTLVKTIC